MKPLECLCLVLLLALPGGVGAEEDDDRNWSFGVGLGGFKPQDRTGTLKNQRGQYSMAVDATWHASRNWQFAVDLLAYDQRFDTPPSVVPPAFGTVDGRAEIAGGGIGALTRFGLPLGRFEPYAGAGIGRFFNSMVVRGSMIGLPARGEVRDSSTGRQVVAGINYRTEDSWSLGLEWRRLFLHADFGAMSNGNLDIGGNVVMLTARMYWNPAQASTPPPETKNPNR